jgi:hypothetical protein
VRSYLSMDLKHKSIFTAVKDKHTDGSVVREGFWWESQKERDNYEDPDVSGAILSRSMSDYRRGLDW